MPRPSPRGRTVSVVRSEPGLPKHPSAPAGFVGAQEPPSVSAAPSRMFCGRGRRISHMEPGPALPDGAPAVLASPPASTWTLGCPQLTFPPLTAVRCRALSIVPLRDCRRPLSLPTVRPLHVPITGPERGTRTAFLGPLPPAALAARPADRAAVIGSVTKSLPWLPVACG